jgi:type II secretory pathway pseudopilin PulG
MFPIVNGNGKRSPRGASGFTVIELVIVMSMMVILVGIVAPRMRVSPTRRVQGMAHQIAGHLELARTRALGQRQLTRVVFDENDRTYTAYVDHDRDGSLSNNGTSDEVEAFFEFGERELQMFVDFGRGNASTIPGDPSLDAVTLASNTLDLSTQGVPDPWGTTGTIYLVHEDDPDAVAAISIASSGSFRAWRWFQGEWQ